MSAKARLHKQTRFDRRRCKNPFFDCTPFDAGCVAGMWITVNATGRITGKFAMKPAGDCIEVSDAALAAVRFPKWDAAQKAIVNDTEAQENERINRVKAELAALDIKMPRALEDLWDAVGKSPPEPVAALIAQKRALRAQLK